MVENKPENIYKTVPYRHGGVWPHGIPIGNSWASIGAIFVLIQELGIETFVEIGIDQGGLSYLISSLEKDIPGFRYFGIEKYKEKVHEKFLNSEYSYSVFFGDFFGNEGQEWLREILERAEKPIMVFCDNGNKPEEVKVVSEIMEEGYILSHDFPREFKETDRPENTTRIMHGWLPGTSLYLMKKEKGK